MGDGLVSLVWVLVWFGSVRFGVVFAVFCCCFCLFLCLCVVFLFVYLVVCVRAVMLLFCL